MTRLRPAITIAEKMIKVDHAGENGAVNIYRGQRAIARIFHRSLVSGLSDFQAHEETHREIFRRYLADKDIRRCVSYHACGLGGFMLGLVTALGGAKSIAATTFAVEHVVLVHLAEQMSHLRQHDPDAFKCVSAIYEDEKEHHDSALSQMGPPDTLTRGLIFVVRLSTEAVISFGMR